MYFYIRENMKKQIKQVLQTVFALCVICIFMPSIYGQTTPVDWRNKISAGSNTVKIHCNINLKETAELYLQMNTLQVTGNITGESGSKIYLSINSGIHGFLDISHAAAGEIEIIPDIFSAWDGSRIDIAQAQHNGSAFDAFKMEDIETGDYSVQLKYENKNDMLIWYIEKTPCLPVIVQLSNHTLLVNNNISTNGGYRFVYYRWYKNGQLLKESSHANSGGSYYTGGADLDEHAEYTVKATDSEGKYHLSCPYRFVRLELPVSVIVYPNPVPRNVQAHVKIETGDISLLKDAFIEVYNIMGQYVGKKNINGQTPVPLNFPAKTGIYILRFRAKDYEKNIKIIVE
jgi:hypothetical protein